MRYSMIMAGGSGTRLWPMSRESLPKQLIPFIDGKSLLQLANERLTSLVPDDCRYVCAGLKHRAAIQAALPGLSEAQFLGEPIGRDTLNAVGLGAAVIAARDPEAIIAVFTADHIIEPVDQFQKIVAHGYRLVEQSPNTLVTFGITPTHPATGYGYLQLGATIEGVARVVEQFKEKPDAPTAEQYVAAGSDRYLWNSGMFVWRADTLLDCIRRYRPDTHAKLTEIASAWYTSHRDQVLAQVFPTLEKISVDFAVMEPSSRDSQVRVAAVPMPLRWLDVGSWPSYAETCRQDAHQNRIAAAKHLVQGSQNCLVASNDSSHLLVVAGCIDLMVIHTPDATLICPRQDAEKVKALQKTVTAAFDTEFV